MPSSEHTPLIHNRSAESAAERGLVGNRYKHQHQYRTTTKVNNIIESDDVLQVKKIKQRKNVRSFRRKRQDFATWKGRSKSMIVIFCKVYMLLLLCPPLISIHISLSLNISYTIDEVGVHCEYDEYNLKKLMNVIYQTLTSDWEIMDCYDVIRLWLPVDDNHMFSAGEEEQLPPGEDNNIGQNTCPSMPEVFVFSFGAVVFWNFKNEETEKLWMEKNLYYKEVVGLKHNAESIDSACDELGFCYSDTFRWHRDVVELQTRDAGEKLAVSFAVAKSANLSILEWRMQSAIVRNAHIPEDLAKYGSLHLSRREINVEVGRLYLLNNAINLETNLLDTPGLLNSCAQ